jgi:predicted nucleic acid-binding protein
VLLKLLLPEEQSDAVRRLWGKWVGEDTRITAPFLLAYEVTSVLRNKVFRGELPSEAGEAAFVAFRTQEISLLHPEGIEEKTWALARQWNLPTGYDAAYLALAELLDYECWTADRKFAATLRKKVPRLRFIAGRPRE